MAASKREKDLARQRAERQAARQAAAAARAKQRRIVVASVAALVLVAGGVGALAAGLSGGSDEAGVETSADTGTDLGAGSSPTAAASPGASPVTAGAAGTCAYTPGGTAAKPVELPPTEGVETEQPFEATMVTNKGTIVFDLLTSKAPCAVNSMRSLAHFSFYDDSPCHRLTTGGIFVLQCGDPTGTGSGGPGYQFAEENLEGATYPRGTIAGAKTATPGTTGSQFFLVYQDSELPPDYTPYGRITKGLEVLDAIAKAGTEDGGGDGKPKEAVVIESLRTGPKAA